MKLVSTLCLVFLAFSLALGQESKINEMLFSGKVYFLEIDELSADIVVSISQEGEELAKTYTKDGAYILQAKVDLSKPFHIYFSNSNYLEKYVTFDLVELAVEQVELPTVYSPIDDFDMEMLRLEYLNNLKSICVAKFLIVKGRVKSDPQFADMQRQKIEDALKI